MSERSHSRRPAAFALNDPDVVVTEAPDDSAQAIRVIPESDAATLPVPVALARPRRRFPWPALFWSALGGLVALWLGLSVTSLVEELFARAEGLGWLGLSLAVLAGLALLVIGAREIGALLRLRAIETLHARAQAAIGSDARPEATKIVRELLHLMRKAPPLARGRARLESHLGDIIDGGDLIRLAERELMTPLDTEAKRLVSAAAKRVSVVTAVSPRAAIDMIFVAVTALGLIRRLAYLYGGRPGALGLLRLMRLCIAHLTVTGGLAVGDSLVQQVLGHGVVAKLSTRLGEGMLNGLLTARLGLAAIEVTRPLPFAALPAPALADLAADLLRRREASES